MSHLHLTVDDALSTTRAVRRRLDLARPVEPDIVGECVALAQQAPTGGNYQTTHFLAVTDPARRLALADLYRSAFGATMPDFADGPARYGERMWESVRHLYDHFHEVPLLLVTCHLANGAREAYSPFRWSILYANAHMATWSFMLAARERGLGTCVTMSHLLHEREAAAVLGLDYDRVVQTSLLPVAHTRGAAFRPAARQPVADVLHWEHW